MRAIVEGKARDYEITYLDSVIGNRIKFDKQQQGQGPFGMKMLSPKLERL